MTKTVVLIHGAWMVPDSWDKFQTRFEAAGYVVLTPTWPYMDRPIDQLRANPHPKFGALTVNAIADHYQAIIEKLPAPPLLVGHSFGGLVVQLLLDRGVGAAGVAIDPGPIGGIVPDPVSLSAALPIVLRLNGWNRPFVLTRAAFKKGFANTAPAAMQDAEYDRLVVPSPGRIFYQAATWIGLSVNPKRRTAPLLITSGDKDRTVVPYLAKAAYRKQSKSAARTDFQSFPGLSHFLIAEPGWENVADRAIAWAAEVS